MFLAEMLRRRDNRVFHDVGVLRGGEVFVTRIRSEVENCDVLFALIGSGWSDAVDEVGKRRLDDPEDLVVLEIGLALELGKTVVPVLVDDAVMPRHDMVPQELRGLPGRHAQRLRYVSYQPDVESLLETVAATPTARPRKGWVPDWIRRYPEHVRAEDSARLRQIEEQSAAEPEIRVQRPPPPPRAARPPAGVRDINELEVAIWTSGAVPVLLEMRATSDRESATDLSEVAEKYAGRLKVGRFAADRSIGLDVVTKLDVTTFPTLLLFHDGVEVRRADDQDARAALLQDLERLLG